MLYHCVSCMYILYYLYVSLCMSYILCVVCIITAIWGPRGTCCSGAQDLANIWYKYGLFDSKQIVEKVALRGETNKGGVLIQGGDYMFGGHEVHVVR